MLEVKKFKCTFSGRRLHATGIYQDFEVILECTFDEVLPRLYEAYRDIHNFKMLEHDEHGVVDQWNYYQVLDSVPNWKYKTKPTPRSK